MRDVFGVLLLLHISCVLLPFKASATAVDDRDAVATQFNGDGPSAAAHASGQSQPGSFIQLAAETAVARLHSMMDTMRPAEPLQVPIHFIMLGTINSQASRARFRAFVTGQPLPPPLWREKGQESGMGSPRPLVIREHRRAWASATTHSSGWTVVVDKADKFTDVLAQGGAALLRGVFHRFPGETKDPLLLFTETCPGKHEAPNPSEIVAYAVSTATAENLLASAPQQVPVYDALKALVRKRQLRMVCTSLSKPVKMEQHKFSAPLATLTKHHRRQPSKSLEPRDAATHGQRSRFLPAEAPHVIDFSDFFDGWQNILASAVIGSVLTCGLCALYISCQTEDCMTFFLKDCAKEAGHAHVEDKPPSSRHPSNPPSPRQSRAEELDKQLNIR